MCETDYKNMRRKINGDDILSMQNWAETEHTHTLVYIRIFFNFFPDQNRQRNDGGQQQYGDNEAANTFVTNCISSSSPMYPYKYTFIYMVPTTVLHIPQFRQFLEYGLKSWFV